MADAERFSLLRAALAARLAGPIQHELRNPLNALSLHSDLLLRMASKAEPALAAKMEASLKTIKARLADLQQRQDHLVELWLAASHTSASPQSLGDSLVPIKAVLNPFMSQQELTLDWAVFSHYDALRVALPPQMLHLLLVAMVTAAAESPKETRSLQWQLDHSDRTFSVGLLPTPSGPLWAQTLQWLADTPVRVVENPGRHQLQLPLHPDV